MTASQGLLPETMRAEANHAEIQHRIDELARRYDAQEKQAFAEVEERLAAINAQFEADRAKMAAELGSASGVLESVVMALSKSRDLEIAALRKTYQEMAEERKKHYEQQKQQYDIELFRAITAVMTAGVGHFTLHYALLSLIVPGYLLITYYEQPDLGPDRQSALSSQPSDATRTGIVMANGSSKKPSCAETASSPPAAAEVPSHVHPLALPTPTPTEADKQDKQPIAFQKGAANNAPTGSPLRPTAQSQSTPTLPFHLHSTIEGSTYQGLASSAQSTAKPAASLEAALDQENVPPEPPISRRHEYQSFTSTRSSPNSDLALKRKVNGESNPESPAASVRAKRTKLETANGPDGSEIDQSDVTLERSVSFEEVYGSPGKPAAYKHVIVQYPLTTGDFYILRCDEHGVHFGEHPLRGAAKHLASAQHGFMSKAHATAIRTLGHRVRDCTKELADKNNREVLKAFKDGSYKAFNANNLSQTKRAELGFPPLDPLNAQKVAQHRKQTAGITDPQPCQFYVTSGADLKCPVLILPWGDISQAGLTGTLADTGIFREFTEDGRPLGVSKLPKCYVYREAGGHVVGIRSWAKGYEEGGPLEKKREFPVLCAESAD